MTGEKVNFLIDCGASSLIGLKARQVALNQIQAIFITHFHADHFGGVPFFILDAQFFSKRTQPLTIAGPYGLKHWYERVLETSFPGSSQTYPKFDLKLVELKATEPSIIAGVTALPFQALHGAPDGSFLAYRFETEGRILAYTGDTEWTETLKQVARDADLFIAKAYFFDKKIKFHLDLMTLVQNLPSMGMKRLILTNMSDDAIDRLQETEF